MWIDETRYPFPQSPTFLLMYRIGVCVCVWMYVCVCVMYVYVCVCEARLRHIFTVE